MRPYSDPMPESVRDLIRGPVESIEHVQLLVALAAEPDHEFTTEEAATAAHLSLDLTATGLEVLHASGVIARATRDGRTCFHHGARNERLRGAVDELVAMYHQRPVTLVRAVYARVPGQAATFSDAFPVQPTPKEHG